MDAHQELKLHFYIRELIGQPFEFGVNDCPLLAAGALDALAGGNRREEMTGLWKDKKSAWVYMKRNGTISEHLKREGCKSIDPKFMQNGDFVIMLRELANEKQWHSVGVCLNDKIAIVSDEEGVIIVERDQLPEIDEVLRWQ
jgi:hypothetical protein